MTDEELDVLRAKCIEIALTPVTDDIYRVIVHGPTEKANMSMAKYLWGIDEGGSINVPDNMFFAYVTGTHAQRAAMLVEELAKREASDV